MSSPSPSHTGTPADRPADQPAAGSTPSRGSVEPAGLPDSGYRQIDHTADLALELWAPDQAELLRVGARAIVDVLTGSTRILADSTRSIALDAVDGEDRLVQWLNEIIVAALVDGFLTSDADIELGETSLRATLHGQASAADFVVTELKSATYHDLVLEEGENGCRARVVIDV